MVTENSTLKQTVLYLPPEILETVDQVRAKKSRNRWIVEAIARHLGRPELAKTLRRQGRPRLREPDATRNKKKSR